MPLQAPVVNPDPPRTGTLSDAWIGWMQGQNNTLELAPIVIGRASYSDQSASIPRTTIPCSQIYRGFYRVSFYARVTAQATTSSSLQVHLFWTDDGIPMQQDATAITGNLLTTFSTQQARYAVDADTTLDFATTYVSVGAQAMEYKLELIVEQVSI